MIKKDLQELLFCALEGAARSVVAYCDGLETPTASRKSEVIAAPIQIPVEKSAQPEERRAPEAPSKVAAESVSDEYPPGYFAYSEHLEEQDTVEKNGYGLEVPDEDPIVVDGVPADHQIHADVSTLLPAFRAISALVDRDDFVVTPETVEAAMPVWVAFNALSRYREDEHFPAILAYVRTHIKPVCFAAMGKEVSK